MWIFSKSSSQPSTGEDDPSTPTPMTVEPIPHPEPLPQLEQPPLELESPSSLASNPRPISGYPNERLSIPPIFRWQLLVFVSFLYGGSTGLAKGGRIAADRYRAMNAHRLPATQAGWYLYHRSKSYHTVVGGVTGGVKRGGVMSGWTTLFMLAEEGLDQARGRLFARKGEDFAPGQRDFVNTTLGALTTAGVYSRWQGMDVFATTKIARSALRIGLVYGLMQDAMSTVRGEPPAYWSWLRRVVGGKEEP